MAALPELQAHQTIDAMLAVAGWAVQEYEAFTKAQTELIKTATAPFDKPIIFWRPVVEAAGRT